MAFEDSLIGNGDDFDPHAATESLIRQVTPEPLPGGSLDPRMLNTRLARKLGRPTPVEPMPSVAEPGHLEQQTPDFSAQAIEPAAAISTDADFSGQAVEPPMIGPEAPPATNNPSPSYAVEFGKGVAEGGKNMGAAALKGVAAVGIPTVAAPELLDELQNLKDKTPAQLAKLQGRVLRDVSDRGLQMDYIAALRRISQGADPKAEVETLKPKFEANNKRATEPVADKPLFKAGQAVEEFGKETLKAAPGFEGSWTRDIGSGAGSMAAGIALSMVPGIGPAAAGTLFTAAGMGEAADRAVKGGATPEQTRLAAKLGGVAGATDLVDALIPMLGGTGKALGFIKRMGVAAVKGALMEGGQEGLQQLAQNAIAKGIYKPDQDLFEDVPRSMAIAAILGGAGGGISGAASRDRQDAPAGIAPPPGGGAAPGPSGDPAGGPSSPEDIADFVRRARESAPPPEGENTRASGADTRSSAPDPASMSEAERQRAYTASRESHGGASETEILKAAGLDPAAMDEQERIDAVIRATKGAGSQKPAGDPAAEQPAAGPRQEAPETEGSHLRYATLREAGYSDEDIDNMSASQRKAEFNDAIAAGIKPGAAMTKHKKRAPKAAETAPEQPASSPERPVDTGMGFGNLGNAGKDIGDSLRDHLWSRAEAGEVTESSTGGPSALLQGAKMVRERGGLKTRDEFVAYAEEQSKLTPGSPTFQQDMRALVEKHSKNDTGQNVPESRATLKAQQNQLIAGERAAQMFPKGTREMPLPPGMERVETERGIFHFDPKKTTAKKITEASAAGRENELLGLGSFSKADIEQRQGERNVTIVERTPDGTEVRAAVGTESTADQQRAEMERGKSPGNTVSFETAEQTLDGRKPKGTRADPIEIKSAADVDAVAKPATNEHTHAQGEANNRQLGHGKWNGLPISIEVAPGGVRKMVNPETGENVEVTHGGAAYGYFPGTVGADGMHVDLYLGNAPDSPTVYVFDEIDSRTGKFRQHKVMGGFRTEQDAFGAYIGTSTKSAETLGASTPMSVDEFKTWLAEGDTTKALQPDVLREKKREARKAEREERNTPMALEDVPDSTINRFSKKMLERLFDESGERITDIVVQPGREAATHFDRAGLTGENGLLTREGVQRLIAEQDRRKLASSGPVKAEDASPASAEAARTSGAVPKETPSPAPGAEAGGSKLATQKKPTSSDETVTLLQFLASRGGLAPDPELTALDIGDHRVQIPGRKGFFGLIRPTGMKLDMAREAAEEAGYLRGEHNKTSTVRDLLDAIDEGLRGQHKVAEGDEGKTTKRQRTSLKESSDAARDAAIIANTEAIQAEYTELPEGLAEQAATIMADELLDLDSAVEMAAVRAVNEDTDFEIDDNSIVETYGDGVFHEISPGPAPKDGGASASAGDQEQRPGEGKEASGDGKPDARAGEEGSEAEGIERPYPYTADRTQPTQIVPLPMELAEFAEITDEWAALFADPDQRVNLETKLGKGPFIPLAEAQARVDQWRADAAAQAENSETFQANSTKTILSLYDLTGNWARPWAEAGYNVLTFDIQSGQDVHDFSVEWFNDNYDITDVYGMLIAQPCTDFAVSGAKHFAKKDAAGDTARSIELVHQSLRTVEYFRPKFWVLENPVSRIEKLTGLPPWRLLFNPNNFGDPYTKKTVLWGKFNADLPTANVDPVEGSKMWAKYGGKSQATKNARSATPEGFAYAFFKANNYADRSAEDRLPDDYPEVAGAVRAALAAGVPEARINELMEDTYGNYEYDEARDALIKEVYGIDPKAAKAMEEAVEDDVDDDDNRWVYDPRGSLEEAQDDTLRHYARGMDIFEADKMGRKQLIDALLEKGARGYQGGGIIAVPKSPTEAIESLQNIGVSDSGAAPDVLFAKFKAALRANPGLMVSRAYEQETEPNGDTWKWEVKLGKGNMGFAAYGADHVYVGSTSLDGVMGSSSKKVVETFMRDFVKAHPVPVGTKLDKPASPPAPRDDLFVEIAGKRLPLTSYAAASEAYMKAVDATGATSSGRTGPQAPAANITNNKGEVVAHISYNGKVWSGDRETAFDPGRDEPTTLLYNPYGPDGWASAENTAAGVQSVIPGAERIGQGEQAQRRTDQGLKPKVAQKPADIGLFGDEMDQADLLDRVERASANVEAIEAALGDDADKVAFVDIARAGEIMADNPGMDPATAFSQAVAIGGVEQGFITEQEAEAAYGPEINDALEAERERASQSGEDALGEVAETSEAGGRDAAQTGELPGSSEDGGQAAVDDVGADAVASGTAEQPAAGRGEAAGDRAGDAVGDQPAAETADDAELARRSAVAAASDNVSYGQGPHFAAGASAFKAGEPRELPGYFTKPKHKNAKDWFRGYDRAMADARDAPTWAEILATLPMSPDGRTRQFEIAFGLMTEMTGLRQPSYNDLTPGQKHELMSRLVPAAKEPIIQAEDNADGVQAPVYAGDAPASPEDVQPAESVGRAGGVRGSEGDGSQRDVPRADGERAEDAGRVSEGARGELGDRASDGGDARLSEARTVDAADGRTKRAARPTADVGDNFVIEPGALDEGRGQKAKARDNIKAIAAMQLIEMEGRPATAAEQADLARYVGWGGIKNIFPDDQGAYGDGFQELGPKLRGLLSDEEYATARRSIQYAHYTAEDVVRGMWDAVAKMGFTGGQVFEPGMGVGNFAGMMPQDIAANSHYQGVELDHVTARIAKLLYPKYGVRQDDFTKTRLPENSYDLVIGNPPFADVAIKSDPKYKQGFLLHDYFFAKSLDAVRPGGLLAFVTSAGTMNKMDPSAREYLADRADLVGAIRLPGDAFLKNAGTAVTTDIIFLRKRLPGDVAGDRSWIETTPITLPGKEGDVQGSVNSYFAGNPRMVLGRQDFNDRLYPGRYSVKSVLGSDLKADLAAAIDNLPADVMSPWQDVNTEQHQHDFDTAEKKEGTYYVGPDGSLHQVTNGVGQKVGQRGKGVENGRTAADMERIKALVPVRDALRAVYAADLKGDTANATRARQALNKTYDDFVSKFGPINKAVLQTRRPNVIQMEAARAEAREEARYADAVFREGDFDATALLDAKTPLSVIARKRQEARDEAAKKGLTFDEGDFDPDEVPDVIIDKRPNVDPFMDDPESYRLRAIEQYDEGTGTGHKSDVFFKNIITREVVPKINSVNDGLLYSLSQYGRVNIPAIAEMVKKTDAEVVEALGDQVFKVPGTKDAFQTRDEYLSGNVRKKLEQAQRAADRNPEFRRNVAALEANQPTPLAPSQIHASLGMPWIPPATIQQFAREELGIDNTKVRYTSALASWTVSGDTDSVASRSTWGTEDRRAPALLQDALNRQTTKIYDTVFVDGKKSQVLNIAKTEAANDKLTQMREKFSGWIWTDQARSDTLAAYYNENFNNLVVREYNGDYLTTPGIASDWSWRPHQKRVIARIIQSGNTYVAHAVGAGKTSEYIGAIMEMRRLGLVRKPMVAVPNHMLAQFTREWYHQYPTARLAIADDKRFHTDRRKQFIANVAMEDLDAIIITHSSFGMIPVSDEFQNSVVEREIAQYREVLASLKSEGGDTRITRSRIEKQIERLEQRLVSRKGRKDATFTFEEMGVDHLTIDEAHLFRKLDFSTAMSNLKGVSPEGSQMAWDLYVKSLYLDTIRPGRGLVLGSGTPITNTMAELYTLSRYLQPQVLAERGLEKFDAWAGAFGESVSELEQDPAGNYKPVSRFAKFVNVAELSAMVRQIMDVVTSKQLEQYVTRPQIKGGKRTLHLVERSPEQLRFQEKLAARMKKIAERKGPPQKGDDIILSVIEDGRHSAIDMRLAGGDKSSSPSKLDYMINRAFEIWKDTKNQKFFKVAKGGGYDTKPAMSGPATQLIFNNLGISGSRGLAVPEYIRAEMVRRGVPKNEVALIYDYKSATAKQRLFNDMNEGKVRILIGSVAKMGVGTNVQKRLYAIHNMDPLWYPADDEQRNGRGIRQGNMNPEIEINDYATKGTYDSTMWGMMAKKGRFIEGFFEGDPSLRDMEDLGEASQYELAKAMTTNDPRLIRFTELKQELERANRRKSAFDSDVYATRQNRQRSKAQIEHYTQRVEDTKKDIKQRVDTRGDAFSGKVGKETFDKRADFGVALFNRLGTLEESGSLAGGVKVATVGGFDIYATVKKSNLIKDQTNVDVFMSLNGNATREVSYETSSLGTVRSIEHILHGFETDLAEYEERLAKATKFVKDSEAKANAKFEGQADIDALTKQVADMAADLAKPVEETAAPVEMTEEGDEELASLSDMSGVTLTPQAEEMYARIRDMLAFTVRKIAGDVPLDFHIGLMPVEPPPGYPAGMKNEAGGQYSLGSSLIKLALTTDADQMAKSAFHESYHHIENKLQTPRERELMQLETPRLRQYIKGRTKLTDAMIDGLAGFEVRAIAFQTYAHDRANKKKDAGAGIHIGVRRWFDRLLDLLDRIRNGLRGLGFQTYKDVFKDAFEGKFAGRAKQEGINIDPKSVAAMDEATSGDTLASLADIYSAVDTRIRSKFGERFTELRVKLQDRFIRVRNVQDSFGGVPLAQNAYMAETLLPGRTGFRLEELERTKIEPMIAEMESRGVSLEEVSDYLYAKHAPERNAAMDAINHPNLDGTGGRDLRGKGSGMSDEEAAEIMDRIRNGNRLADFEAVEAMVRDIQQGTLDTLVEYGLISEETAAAWASQYDHYVPLQGFDEAFEDETLAGQRGAGLDTRAKESKRAFGRLSKAAGPLPYILMQAQLAIVRGEKNRVGNTFLRLVRAHPNPALWSINTPKLVPTIDHNTGLVTMIADTNWHNDPNVFVTKIGGQINVIRLEGKDGQNIARALKNMGVEELGWVLSFIRPLTVTMARLSTQWNPNFILPNFARDLGEAYINMQAQEQADFIKNFTKHLIPAIGGSFQAMRGQGGGRYADAFREYDKAGGRVRFFGLDNAADMEKAMRRQMRALQGGPVANIQEMGKQIGDALDLMSGPMENATRLAAYMAARDAGMTIPESANLALNITVNFAKGGELRAVMNSLYMFSQAALSGARRNIHALKNPHVRRATYVLVGIGALSAVLGFGAGGDDEAGESYYGKIPHWERDKNLIIMWPKGFGRDGGYIKIPTPFLFGTMKVIGDRLAGLAMGKDKIGESVGAVLKSLIDSLNPLGEESVSLFSLAPSVTRPPLHIATNKNWNGRPVYPERDFEKNKPESEQFFETTPGYAKDAARGLNKLGGGSPYKSSGTLDVHPGSIQHTLESMTGGLGKFISDVAGTAERAWKGEAFDPTKAPIMRRFVGSSGTGQADSARYYAERDEARKNGGDAIKNARKDRAKGVNRDDADSFLKDNTNSTRGEQIFKSADALMKPLRDRKSRIEGKDSFSDTDRAAVEEIKQRMRDIQNRARKEYRELKQGAP